MSCTNALKTQKTFPINDNINTNNTIIRSVDGRTYMTTN